MKKLFFIIAVAGIGFGATSCKKERTCECTFTNGSGIAYSGTLGKVSWMTKNNNVRDWLMLLKLVHWEYCKLKLKIWKGWKK